MKKVIKSLVILIVLYFVISNIVILFYARSQPAPNADTLIILGSQVVGDPARPGKSLTERLDTAIVYLEQNPATKVIVCGGQGHDEADSEANVMKNYLIDKGIAASRIYQEDQSTRTAQQFIYAKKLMELGNVVVVSSDFHLLRSIMLAKRSGVDNITGLAATVAFSNPDRWTSLIREPLALINSYLFDHPQQLL